MNRQIDKSFVYFSEQILDRVYQDQNGTPSANVTAAYVERPRISTLQIRHFEMLSQSVLGLRQPWH